MHIKSVKMKISKNKNMRFFSCLKDHSTQKIRFLGQKVTDRQTDGHTEWLLRAPFLGFRIFSFNLSSRIGPIISRRHVCQGQAKQSVSKNKKRDRRWLPMTLSQPLASQPVSANKVSKPSVRQARTPELLTTQQIARVSLTSPRAGVFLTRNLINTRSLLFCAYKIIHEHE